MERVFCSRADYAGGVTSEPDEDGLRWEGDESPATASLPPGWKAVGKGSGDVPDDSDATPRPADSTEDGNAGLSNAALMGVGALAGAYLLYTIGWVIGGVRMQDLARLIVADAIYLPWMVLAIAAPTLWFLTTWVLTRGRATWVRILLLVAGLVLLIPWPFVMIGALGS